MTQDGSLFASKANITGKITATSGRFDYVSIYDATIYDVVIDSGRFYGDGVYNDYNNAARWKYSDSAYLFQSGNFFGVYYEDGCMFEVRSNGSVYIHGGQFGFADHPTTTNPANCLITADDGRFYRSTSAAKYKTQIEPIDEGRAEAFFTGCSPTWYRSLCEDDRKDWSWYGYIADEVATVEPRLVQLGADGEPEGFNYDHVAPLLHVVMRGHRRRIEALEREIAELKAKGGD